MKQSFDNSTEHCHEVTAEENQALTGGMLGTSTGRIADNKSGSTPGPCPNAPDHPNPSSSAKSPLNAKSSSSSSSRAQETSKAGGRNAPASNFDASPAPGAASATGLPGTPGATGPIPTAPDARGSPIGSLNNGSGRTATNATSSASKNNATRKYSTKKDIDTSGTVSDINAKIGGILGLVGAPTFVKGENVIDLIKRDHRLVESMYKEYQSTKDKKKAEEISREIVKNLVQHSEIEQQLVYPLLKFRQTSGGQTLHDRSLTEHQEARDLLMALDKTSIDDPSHPKKMKAAMDAISKHVAEEESETLPLLAEKYALDELQRVGSAFQSHKNIAPTHPHPSAPLQGPFAAAAGLAAKPIDLARDALHKVADKVGLGKKE